MSVLPGSAAGLAVKAWPLEDVGALVLEPGIMISILHTERSPPTSRHCVCLHRHESSLDLQALR
jgi:hypothetical protein